MAEAPATAPSSEATTAELEGGSYEVIRKRLLAQAAELGRRAEALNQKRLATFGGSKLELVTTERVRTENNCVPRDIRQVQGRLLFGYNVFIGLRQETKVGDVFSVYDFARKASGTELAPLPLEQVAYLQDPAFVREFTDLYRYNKDTKLLMIRVTDTRLLAIFQVGARMSDSRVFRWSLEKNGEVRFLDARGEEDNILPRQHDFEWRACTRDDQVPGERPHYAVLDRVFVDTTGGALTVRIEDNTKSGKLVFNEPVDDANQTLDDAELAYAKLGALIVLRVRPYREPVTRFVVFNTRTESAVRIDAVGQACLTLPEDQGIVFPGGYYLRTGESKVFDGDARGMIFRRAFKAPNGEDVLFVFDRLEDGLYLLLPYNLIRKEVQNPITCHGYSLFEDGTLVIFKSLSDEPTRVHPMQVWQTPFCTQEHAAKTPTDGSYLANVGNAELVRGISEALTLQRVAASDSPTRQTFEDAIASSRRMIDAFYWLGHAEAENLAEAVSAIASTSDLIIDEYEKVAAMRKRAAEAIAAAEQSQTRAIEGARPDDLRSVEAFMGALADLRKQRGSLITLRDLRYVDVARIATLEEQVVAAFDAVSQGAVRFLLKPEALRPLVGRLAGVAEQVAAVPKSNELKPIADEVDRVGEGLGVLNDVVTSLAIDDPTDRTRILEGVSEAYAQLNRARATLAGRRKELSAAEGRTEFGVQFKLFGQAVVSALALADTPEKCDEALSRLLLSLEELEGRFGEFDEFLGPLTEKREEVTDAVAAKRQALLDERQRRAQNLVSAAERVLGGIARKARTLATQDELNTYFASDAMVLKLRDLARQLFEIGATVKGDELEARLKSARQDAIRALRDKTELFEGGANLIRLGKHRFHVNTQPVELALVPRRDDATGADVLYVHLTGTDYFERIDNPALEAARDLWDQPLVSESADVYRCEYLAASVLFAAERGDEGLAIDALVAAQLRADAPTPEGANPALLEVVRQWASTRHEEGYERGVHDLDAALVLEKALALRAGAGLLRYAADARALACLAWAALPDADRTIVARRARSVARIRERLGSVAPQRELAAELEPRIAQAASEHRIDATAGDVRSASLYWVEELAQERPRFVLSGSAATLRDALVAELDRAGSRRDFEEDLRTLERLPAERLGLVLAWLAALVGRHGDLAAHSHAVREAAIAIVTERRVDREVSSAPVEAVVAGLLGQHARVKDRALPLRLDAWLARLERYVVEHVPRFRAYRKLKLELLDRERKRLRLDEYTPRVLSSFVRNRLIDEVYLPLVGDNLAKQLGAAGEGKRTDQMGLLLLVSPPGYGKTTLMEYVANRLGLIFMKVNGPALGHEVTSVDPEEAPNATARQEIDKVNLALELGNNVMLYLDDIQHTNPELLQKFISLCDAQRRVEGVWRGKTRTYDLRGKKFCIVMAGNPYTESGAKFKIPDMLANRADTYNLGDILEGKDELFALSYLENALTSNKVLAPLSGREPEDTRKLLRMAQGEAIAASELSYAYSGAEVGEIVEVLKRLFQVQRTLLRVNLEYILSASQDDAFRTEPPFKLQGSYRNMNKIAEKVVAAHTVDEIERIVDDHYAGESQTLTTGAEQNLLKLAELRKRQSPEQAARWTEIKKSYGRAKTLGGKDDDPVVRVTGSLAALGEQLEGGLGKLSESLAALATKDTLVHVEHDPRLAEVLVKQLGAVEAQLAPVVRAVSESLLAASQAAQSSGRHQAEAVASALGEATQRIESIAASQAQAAAQAAQTAAIQARALDEKARAIVSSPPPGAGASQVVVEVQSATARVERRLGELTDLVRQLQARVSEGAASIATSAPAIPAARGSGRGGASRGQLPLDGAVGEGTGPISQSGPGSQQGRYEATIDRASPSNFYAWRTGADVVTEGGVFVATRRKPPALGTEVRLAITLPGGLELEARGIVEWSRPAGHNQGPPGFGARFVDLPSYGRQLVDHFVQSRAPLVFESK